MKALFPSPFLRDVIFTTITSAATVIALLVVTRLLAQGLGPEAFGAYSLSRRILSTVFPFSTLAMGIALARFVSLAKDERGQYAHLVGGIVLGVFPSLAVLLVGWTFRRPLTNLVFRNSEYSALFVATLLLIVGYSFYSVLFAFYRGQGRMTLANLWQLGVVAAAPLAITWALVDPGNLVIIILLFAAAYSIACIPLGVYCMAGFRLGLSLSGSVNQMKPLLKYGLPRVPGGLALGGLLAVGPFLAPYFGSLSEAGYLVACQSVFGIVESGVAAFGLVALPKVAQLHAGGQTEFLGDRITDILAFVVQIGLFVTLHLFLWADQIVLLVLGPQYRDAVPLLRVSVLGLVPFLSFVMLRSVIDAIEEKAINTMSLFVSLAVAIVLSFLLAGLGLGTLGLAIATCIGFLVLGGLTFSFLWKLYQPDWRSLLNLNHLAINAGLLAIAFVAKLELGSAWLGLSSALLVLTAECAVFLVYLFLLWKLKTRWTLQLEMRLIRRQASAM